MLLNSSVSLVETLFQITYTRKNGYKDFETKTLPRWTTLWRVRDQIFRRFQSAKWNYSTIIAYFSQFPRKLFLLICLLSNFWKIHPTSTYLACSSYKWPKKTSTLCDWNCCFLCSVTNLDKNSQLLSRHRGKPVSNLII